MKPPGSAPVGRFAIDVATGKCAWDAETYRIYGHPDAVEATLDLMLEGKHPEDRQRVEDLLLQAGRTGERFSASYRILGGDGAERRVVMVGEVVSPNQAGAAIEGYLVDLTLDFEQEAEEVAGAAVQASAASRAAIEQAKGILMLVYGLDPEAAFAMLRWWSRNRNVKVRDLAGTLVVLAEQGYVAQPELQVAVDALLHDIAHE